MKDILNAPFMVEMIRTATNMYDHGWDERNGGNISVMLDEAETGEYLDAVHYLDGLGIQRTDEIPLFRELTR